VVAGGVAVLSSTVGAALAGRAARRRVKREALTARFEMTEAVDKWVVGPVDTELAAYDTWRRALAEALAA
jgi:hypothetical protein